MLIRYQGPYSFHAKLWKMSYLVNGLSRYSTLLVLTSFIKAHVYHLCNTRWADIRTTCPHRLSLLFAILAIGALFDPSRAQLPDADDYYHLSRVALALKSAVTETTVNAVSAIVSLISLLVEYSGLHGYLIVPSFLR